MSTSHSKPPASTATPSLTSKSVSSWDDQRLASYRGRWGWLIFCWDCLRFGILPTLAARRHARRVLTQIEADAEAAAQVAVKRSTEVTTAAERTSESTAEPIPTVVDNSPLVTTPTEAVLEQPLKPVDVIDDVVLEKTASEQTASEKLASEKTASEPVKPKVSFMARLRAGMQRSNSLLTDDLRAAGKGLDDDTLEELEMRLVSADVGIQTTTKIIAELNQKAAAGTLLDNLKTTVMETLEPCEQPLDTTGKAPFVLLMVGVNGVGKTTTIGKLAKKFQVAGQSVMLAAGDTFRAAAVEQLKTWGERNQVPVVAQAEGADSASVIFDALESAKAKGIDVLIADTAGRLHTQSNLMEELKKVVRVMQKLDATAPHEVMLVVDGGTGQNALVQAQQFQQAVDVSGVTVTKLDGTAKGGVIVAIADQLQIPIRFVGVGESVDDLGEFKADEFAAALVGHG